jgi:hypothetical protein
MSILSMSDVVDQPQPGRSGFVTLSSESGAIRRLARFRWVDTEQVRHAVVHYPTLGVGSAIHSFNRPIIGFMLKNRLLSLLASAQAGTPETIRVLLVCLVVMLAIIVSICAAIIWKSDGQSLRSAILKGGATFAAATTIFILILSAAGFI